MTCDASPLKGRCVFGGKNVIKHLVKHGNNWALLIDEAMLEQLQIDPASPVEVSVNGNILTVMASERGDSKAAMRAASDKVNSKHESTFRKLAE
jgi:antitoxin component of MazEF toxin-antitoxin module